jgi:anthranilate phosphoribosyltransferase
MASMDRGNTPAAAGGGMEAALGKLADGESLARGEARAVMDLLLEGKATPAQTGAFLMGLRLKGETEEEVVGLVAGMRAAGVKVRPRRDVIVDLCGTGGDHSGTFNISTAASLLVAACGVAVAKHGNRSASSRCGSADVLEALGVPIDLAPERAERSIEELGFAFLFAPLYHPAMKHVGPARRELKVRTVFNILGPLASPAAVTRQLVGVFEDAVRSLLARVLRLLGTERAWVVHGDGNLDEITIAGVTRVTESTPDAVREFHLRPEDAGFMARRLQDLAGGDAGENARIIESILSGEGGARRDVVLLNAAAGLIVAGAAAGLEEGVERAAAAIDSGAARKLLEKLRSFR